MPSSHLVIWAISFVSIALMLLRPRRISEVWWVCGGAIILILFHLISLATAWHAIAEGTDVYLFLTGMMLLAQLAQTHGVFDWLATVAIQKAKGSRTRLFALIYGVGTIVTIFMSNDATAVVLTPAVLAAVKKSKAEPLPYLFVCAFIANAASFVLPISNPANLVVFHDQMPPLGRWLLMFGVPSMISIVATFCVLRWIFRNQLRGIIVGEATPHPLTPHGKFALAGLSATAVVLLVASALNWDLGLPTCIVAAIVTTVVSIKSRTNPLPILREVSWSTLALVAGLFVMVDAAQGIGALNLTREWLAWAGNLAPTSGALVTGFVVGIANNLVNNLPLGLIAGSTLHAAHASGLIATSLLIGVDLGPNLSITGSLATILWLIALRKENLDVSFWSFLKVGIVAMPVALFFSLSGAIAMRFVFGS